MLLGPASSTVVTVVRADGTLASNTLISSKALALTSVTVANSLVRALSPGVKVVGIDHVTNPGKVLGTGALRAIRAGPLSLAINAGVALAVVVELAGSVAGALVLAHTGAAVTSLVPGVLATGSPGLVLKRRLTGRHGGGLASGLGRHGCGSTRRNTSGLVSRSTKSANKGGEHNNSFNHCLIANAEYDLG